MPEEAAADCFLLETIEWQQSKQHHQHKNCELLETYLHTASKYLLLLFFGFCYCAADVHRDPLFSFVWAYWISTRFRIVYVILCLCLIHHWIWPLCFLHGVMRLNLRHRYIFICVCIGDSFQYKNNVCSSAVFISLHLWSTQSFQ